MQIFIEGALDNSLLPMEITGEKYPGILLSIAGSCTARAEFSPTEPSLKFSFSLLLFHDLDRSSPLWAVALHQKAENGGGIVEPWVRMFQTASEFSP